MLLKCMNRQDFHELFRPIRKLGSGSFASVYMGKDIINKRIVAIKAFVKEVAFKQTGWAGIENEIKIMRMIDNKNLVKLFGVY